MPRLREKAVVVDDLLEYLNGYSDFSFELQTLNALRALGLECEHAGLYEDPTTRKSREFDIRAVARVSNYCVRLAIECKNVREYFPLLVLCVPRHSDEAFHEIAWVRDPPDEGYLSIPTVMRSRAGVLRLRSPHSCYKARAPVGKALAQVGRLADRGATINASDSDIFDKWAQCLASADDLVTRNYWEGEGKRGRRTLTWVLPLIVIPDGRLWIVEYDTDGARQSDPKQVDHCSLFVNKSYSMHLAAGPSIAVSHIDIVTSAGLLRFVSGCLRSEDGMKEIFQPEGIKTALMQMKRDEEDE